MTHYPEKYLEHLKEIGQGSESLDDMAHSAMILALMDRPGVSRQKYDHHLKILALDIENDGHAAKSALERAEALSSVLAQRHDYRGNEKFYDDLQNANLMSVIDQRKGLPVTLGILYIYVARSMGWKIEGLSFPAHFLVRLYGEDHKGGDQVILDPFHGGEVLNARDLREMLQKMSGPAANLKHNHYAAVSDRAILVRLLNNIKTRCLKVSDINHAINILFRLTLIDPEKVEHKYELGMLQAHAGRLEEGRETLLNCLTLIDRVAENELMKQQITNTLEDMKDGKSNILTLHDQDEE